MMKNLYLALGVCVALALLVPVTASAQFDNTGNWTTSLKLGAGTDSPVREVHAHKSGSNGSNIRVSNNDGFFDMFYLAGRGGYVVGGVERFTILENGNVGVGTLSPARRFHVHRSGSGGANLQLSNSDGSVTMFTVGGRAGYVVGGGERLTILSNGNIGIGDVTPSTKLDVAGEVKCTVLQITGGSDLSERFDVKTPAAEPGMVVAIDVENPGKLIVSAKAYDRTVAGIISGAGGVQPGMIMGQSGTLASGEHPVALSGRVYCNVDATNAAVIPGDLLTTSTTPGHAMKVTDYALAQGAIIGKAMTPLAKGEKGQVLVLVSLQ